MIEQLRKLGFTANTMYLAALVSIALSIAVWFLRRDEDRQNAERFGIFIGLWAPTFMAFANALSIDDESEPS